MGDLVGLTYSSSNWSICGLVSSGDQGAVLRVHWDHAPFFFGCSLQCVMSPKGVQAKYIKKRIS